MRGYGKVFSSLWTGSMRGKPYEQLVFAYMLSNCDASGVIDVIPEVIADATGFPLVRVVEALESLEGPDPRSRTPDDDGRRIVRLDTHRDWGWIIVNYEKYRDMADPETVRQQNRERARRYRQRHAASRSVTPSNAPSRQAEAEAEAVEKTPPRSARRRVSGRKETAGFVEFYETVYPNRVGRDVAWRKWQSVTACDLLAEERVLESAAVWAEYWKRTGIERRFIPHPATWLGQGRWKDLPQEESR